MDLELLKKALENDENVDLINTSIQEIKNKKNDILQQLGLKRDELKMFNASLKGYRYIEELKDLKIGSNIRYIKLSNIENIKLSGVNNLCEIKVLNHGIGLVFKNFQNRFFTIYFNDNLIFQKINSEEEIILKAIKHLNK
jgi:CRISPR/Cas system-associated endonuclease Cas3-HD